MKKNGKIYIIMCGYAKGAKTCAAGDLNAVLITSEKDLLDRLSYIDNSTDKADWLYKDGSDVRLTAADILTTVKVTPLRCESKYHCFLFKRI